jgi:hypothetical protein
MRLRFIKMDNKINWEKYSKEDRKFLINLSIMNRDYCAQIYAFLYSFLISFSALMIAIYSIYFSIAGLNQTSVILGIFFLILIVISWIIIPRLLKKKVWGGLHNLNKQYQEIFKSLNPELFEGGYFY